MLGNGLGIVLAMTIVTSILCRVPFGLERIHVGSIQLTTIRCLPSGIEWIRFKIHSDVLGPHRSYDGWH